MPHARVALPNISWIGTAWRLRAIDWVGVRQRRLDRFSGSLCLILQEDGGIVDLEGRVCATTAIGKLIALVAQRRNRIRAEHILDAFRERLIGFRVELAQILDDV